MREEAFSGSIFYSSCVEINIHVSYDFSFSNSQAVHYISAGMIMHLLTSIARNCLFSKRMMVRTKYALQTASNSHLPARVRAEIRVWTLTGFGLANTGTISTICYHSSSFVVNTWQKCKCRVSESVQLLQIIDFQVDF